MSASKLVPQRPIELPEGVLAVRAGPGANCSSIGSVIDMLFATAVIAGVAYAGVVASLGDGKAEQVGGTQPEPEAEKHPTREADDEVAP